MIVEKIIKVVILKKETIENFILSNVNDGDDGDSDDDDDVYVYVYVLDFPSSPHHHLIIHSNLYSSNLHNIPNPYDLSFHTTHDYSVLYNK